jgi:hypothetical protein
MAGAVTGDGTRAWKEIAEERWLRKRWDGRLRRWCRGGDGGRRDMAGGGNVAAKSTPFAGVAAV